ncbi:MAG: glycine cleavage system protein T, partial [Mesorhizobium sp.]
TVARLDNETFYLFGSGAAQNMHRRWFETHLPPSGVTYNNRSDALHGLAIAGPRSRELIQRVTREDLANSSFRFRDIRRMSVGGVPAIAARVSFSGELGYEIYVAPHFQ